MVRNRRTSDPAIWKFPKRDLVSCAPRKIIFIPKPTDIFVTPDTIRRNFLREGSLVVGPTQPPHRGTSPQLKTVEKVNDMPFEDYTKAVRFENLTSIDPIEKFQLETDAGSDRDARH